ncbi:xanthine dehydrogenase family protein molybdopterin-binding subunit [Actinophytocola oryzae]|uniref:CO/xanthine dehydrogenase Mo-binding subunit n=1 Tax=Actinophytocola oryzae TaxID=502181 RepID=A0A4R7UWD4_9PSEU|nr:xanthine dehydrogenase family protein molybdopterin-binding subunit [Actinophytocola oryzae]TDV41098.1 CO/xanthine dehydrogenase Mo-binding subunit [Actinophytocola oryzae]
MGDEVGRSRARFDMPGRVRGLVSHVGDQPVGTAAHVALHRSTAPHAAIAAVHTDDALAIPGVHAVVTGADLYKHLGDRLHTGPAFADQPGLAYEKVRYVGEPVAAVLAVDLRTAREAADAVWVDYDELPPVHDLAAALEGTSFVHDELRPSSVFGDLRHLRGVRDTNVNYEYNLRTGDAEAARDAGATTVACEFWAPPTHHVPIELPCTIAWVDADRLEMLSTTQTPSYVRQTVADLLDLPLSRVRITTRPLGGSFGAKMYDRLEPLAAALAWTTGRKVRVVASREESFLLTTRHGAAVTSSLTADAEGNLVSAISDVRYDTGAYADVGPRITAKSGMMSPGPYRIANARVRSRCVYTNKPSAGPFRGFGVPQVTWSHESLIDELAHRLGEDPVEFRRRHLLREGDEAPMGTRMHSADFVGCLDAVADAIGWRDPVDRGDGRVRRGRGVGVGVKAVLTPTIANAVLHLNQDASATLLISTVDMGQGSDTIMAQIAADVLCMDSARVHVVRADTDATPYDTITAGSRSTYHTGNAVRRVAEAMRAKLVGLAATRFSCQDADVTLAADGLRAGERHVTVPDLVHGHFGARGATLTTEANYTSDWVPYDKETGRSAKVTEHWFAGAVGVQLTVDTATGRVHLEHLAVAGDVGRAINPKLVEQQLTGAAIMGIGHALFDQLVLDQGQVINGTLLDYQLPSIRDLPDRLTPIIVESPHDTGPFGAKGVGETGILGVAPAIANAVRDALGVRITTLPLTPESIVAALEGK